MRILRAYCITASAALLSVPGLAFGQSNDGSALPEAAPPAVAPAPPPPLPADPPMQRPKQEDLDDKPAANSVFAELLGPGVIYSVNYERRVYEELGVRVGFSYLPLGNSKRLMTFPITASYLGIRNGMHALEIGCGATLALTTPDEYSSKWGAGGVGDILIGYRLHPVGHAGFQFRVGLTALFGPASSLWDSVVFPLPYISFGAGF